MYGRYNDKQFIFKAHIIPTPTRQNVLPKPNPAFPISSCWRECCLALASGAAGAAHTSVISDMGNEGERGEEDLPAGSTAGTRSAGTAVVAFVYEGLAIRHYHQFRVFEDLPWQWKTSLLV